MKTDGQLQNEVMEELRREPSVTASEIGVAVHAGTVTLSGNVPTLAEKRAAEQTASRVAGVKAVAEEIKVKPTGRHQRSDTEIAEMVAHALKAHVWVPTDVTATVENGWVTLNGVVNWEFQIRAAIDAIRYLAGVKGITSGILIQPTARPAEVKRLIEEDLTRHAELDARSIQVEAHDGKVILSGAVETLAEREEAARVAYRAPGSSSWRTTSPSPVISRKITLCPAPESKGWFVLYTQEDSGELSVGACVRRVCVTMLLTHGRAKMNIHDKGQELVQKEETKLNEEFQRLKEVLQQDVKELEKLDQLIRKAEKDEQDMVPRWLED